MQIETNPIKRKLAQSIEKSAQLLKENKHYQFAQKVKMLAQRKCQTNKHEQGETLLVLGIQKMINQQKIEINTVDDLIATLLELYKSNETLWKETSPHQIYHLLTSYENPKTIQYFLKIIKTIAPLTECPQIAEYIISYFQKRQLFYKAENFVLHFDLSRVNKFLEKWHEKVDNQQYTIIVCRMALLKGLFYDFDQPTVLLLEVEGFNPFVKFTKFLIQAVQMKSRSCYDKLQSSYQKFLESDSFFSQIFESYGIKYFNKERKEASGLMGLMSK